MPLEVLLATIGAGVSYSLLAWGKKEGQSFEYTKFGTTVAIGAVLGVAMYAFNTPFDLTMSYLVGLGAVPAVENILKLLYRKVLGKKKKK